MTTKERIKSLLLTVLVCSSMILTGLIWFDEKLWPDGYDFFSVYSETFLGRMWNGITGKDDLALNIDDTGALKSIFAPQTTMLSYADGSRISYNSTQATSEDITKQINNAISKALLKSKQVEISEDEWQSALKDKSIFADYSVPVSFHAISVFLNGKSTDFEIMDTFDKICVNLHTATSSSVPIYFRNSSSNKQIAMYAPINPNTFEQILLASASASQFNISYSFELNLDKRVEGVGGNHQKIVIDSYVLLPLNSVNLSVINRSFTDMRNSDNLDDFLKLFRLNLYTARKLVQADNTTLYVDSNSTLLLGNNGHIEYIPSVSSKGIKIGEDNSVTTAAAGSAKLIDTMLSYTRADKNTTLFISSPLLENPEGEYTFTFDYLFSGNPVASDMHGLEVTVKNGYITSLKAELKNYTLSESGISRDPLELIDELYTKLSSKHENITIDELYFGYYDSASPMTLAWQAKVNKSEEVITVR